MYLEPTLLRFAEANGGYDAFFQKFNDDRIAAASSHRNN